MLNRDWYDRFTQQFHLKPRCCRRSINPLKYSKFSQSYSGRQNQFIKKGILILTVIINHWCPMIFIFGVSVAVIIIVLVIIIMSFPPTWSAYVTIFLTTLPPPSSSIPSLLSSRTLLCDHCDHDQQIMVRITIRVLQTVLYWIWHTVVIVAIIWHHSSVFDMLFPVNATGF